MLQINGKINKKKRPGFPGRAHYNIANLFLLIKQIAETKLHLPA